MKLTSIIFTIVIFMLTGCASTQPIANEPQLYVTAPSITQSSGNSVNDAYPALTMDSAYPGVGTTVEPVISERIILDTGFDPHDPVPTPTMKHSTVTGHIVFKETNAPLINVPIILAEIYRNEEGDGAFVYDTATSPYALTDDNGRFIFANIKSMEYIIVVGNIEVNRYELLTEPDGTSRIINAPLDEVLDLGAVEVGLEW